MNVVAKNIEAEIPVAESMNLVIAGHVDHGKSTVIGRLLADTNSLPEGKLERVRETCERNAKPFEYAFLIDALKDEQSQGITIDSARVFFHTDVRDYIIIDAPGHIEFLKNMISGAARASAALLVIDAEEGVQENSRRHGYMLSMLGVQQIAVLVNKMDLIDYDEARYKAVVQEYTEFLKSIDVTPVCFVPCSAFCGDTIATLSDKMPWYTGKTVLGVLDSFSTPAPLVDKPLRLPVQDVYKFTARGDKRRLVAGSIESGIIRTGDDVIFYPSGKKSTVQSIEAFNADPADCIEAGQATALTLREQIYIQRGEIMTKVGEAPPLVANRIRASIFWLGKEPMDPKKRYQFKLGTGRSAVYLDSIERLIDASNLDADDNKTCVERHDVADCVLKLEKDLALDTVDSVPHLGRFVIIDNYDIVGGGIVREIVQDEHSEHMQHIMKRNTHWERAGVLREERAERFAQQPALVLITGPKAHEQRKDVAKMLERRLFLEGRVVYYLRFGNVRHGLDADIAEDDTGAQEELMRRFGEVANLLLDAGMIVVATAAELTERDVDVISSSVSPVDVQVVWVGEEVTTDSRCALHVMESEVEEGVQRIKELLQEQGTIFRGKL